MSAKYPTRRHYRPGAKPVPHQELPFATELPGLPRLHCWQVPPTDNYHEAYRIGREFAGHYSQYVQDNASSHGHALLARIAGDIDFSDQSAARGYWAGFFALIEQVLIFPIDIFDYIDRVNAREASLREMMSRWPRDAK
jgi:hypothetical protein